MREDGITERPGVGPAVLTAAAEAALCTIADRVSTSSGGPGGPVAVVHAGTAAEVAATVRLARRERLGIAVLGPGRPAAGAGQIAVDVSALDAVTVHPALGIAVVQISAEPSAVEAAAAAHDLRPSADLLAVEMVTADGHVVAASRTAAPELIWAIAAGHAGAAGFGIVTARTLRLLTRPCTAARPAPPDPVRWMRVRAAWDPELVFAQHA
ncbi:FAD-binding protein [Pseudonocardia sp. CA-107938]|uniref:FAD-binding protein n=1 Tax=Pseudonocardia sp. CA-107938 TaxID=3240021 RepID=UPI003D8CF825